MQTRDIRFLRRSLVVIATIVLAWVAYDYIRIWRSRIRAVKQAARILDSDLIRAADSIEYSENENGRLRFKIRARKLLETRRGKNLLEGIEAFDFNPDGSPRNHIISERASYDQENGRADFAGDVRIRMEKDVELRCNSLFYDLKNNVGTTDDTMQLVSPQAKGSARGIRYDNAARILQLKGAVDLELNRQVPGAGSAGAVEKGRVTSQTLLYSEKDLLIRFMGGAHLDAPDAALSGNDIEARLSSDRRRIVSLMCQGRAEYRSKKPGDAQTLQGDRIDFDLSQEGKAIERIRVAGNAVFSSAGKDATVGLEGGTIDLALNPADGTLRRILSKSNVRFRSRRTQGDTSLNGESLVAEFFPGSSSVRQLQMRDRATLSMTAGPENAADELTAREIRIDFAEGSEQNKPRRLEATDSVRWASAARKAVPGRKAEPGRTLTAARLDIVYSQSGDSIETGSASGNVRISMQSAPDAERAPVRRLEAERVRFGFYPVGNRMKNLEGEGGVRVFYESSKDEQGKGGGEVQTASERMQARFREGDGQAEEVSQWGGFVYRDGARTASSGRADYSAGNGALILRESPKVTDPDSTTTGEELVYHLNEKKIVVRDNVRSVIRAKQPGEPALTPTTGTLPATVVTARAMQYWTDENRARYEGGVQMLSEEGQLQARVIEILDSGRELAADGQVRHLILRRPESAAQGPNGGSSASAKRKNAKEASQVLIRSNSLRYDKSGNTVHYAGDVVLDSGDIKMWSDTLDAMLGNEGKQIESARAIGHLRIQQQGRLALGSQADYAFAPGKFVVLGSPAEITDPVRGKSVARRLTFFTSDDRIILEKS